MAGLLPLWVYYLYPPTKGHYMKRSEIDAAIDRAIGNASKFGVALPKWADWHPLQFDASADGIRTQKLGWKVIDFGVGDFANCGLVLFALTSPLVDEFGAPLTKAHHVGAYDYPVTAFSRKFLFVQAGQTEPHHFHRQKQRKEVTVVAGGSVRFELAWADSDTTLSDKDVDVQVDGIWHHLPANGSIVLNPGETITLPGNLSHIISVPADGSDVIMLETSTANNDRSDNIFPFMTPTSKPVLEDVKARYQLLDEHSAAVTR
jgi:D-lyxose ketol-isomerase